MGLSRAVQRHLAAEPGEKSIAIISPHYPPSTLASVHRARHLSKHLPAHGWRAIVITTDAAHYSERPDPALAAMLPDSDMQIRVGAIDERWTRFIGVGDVGLRSYLHYRRALLQLASSIKIEAVLITGSPYYPMLLSSWIKKDLGIPVILDFQDPWVSAYGASRPKWSKAGAVHQLALLLEPMAIRHADFITSVSATQNAQMAGRYPWLDPARMAAIPIGGDPDDFIVLRRARPESCSYRLDPQHINLSYVGTLLPRAEPIVRQVFRALRQLKQTHPALAMRIRLHFVGTSNQPSFQGRPLVTPIAVEEGVADLIAEVPQRVPYLDALAILANSHGLVLIGSDEPHYTASKIYPALMSGRPFISLFHAASSSHDILGRAGGGAAIGFDTPPSLQALVGRISHSLWQLAAEPTSLGQADPSVYEAYTACAIAGQYAGILDGLTRVHSR